MDPSKTVEKPKKKKANRCCICRSKVGIIGFTCECSEGKFFCSKHRHPEDHNCSIDYTQKKDSLIKSLPKITNSKIIKI